MYPGTVESKQRGSVWCVLAAVLFIQHIILMSVTPTTFWAGQSSVITEALLLVVPNLKLVSRALRWPQPYKHLSQRPPFTDSHQKCHQMIVDWDLFWLKNAVFSFASYCFNCLNQIFLKHPLIEWLIQILSISGLWSSWGYSSVQWSVSPPDEGLRSFLSIHQLVYINPSISQTSV